MKKPLVQLALSLFLFSCGVASPDDDRVESVTGEMLVCPPNQGTTPGPPDPCSYHITRAADAIVTMGANVTVKEQQVAAPNQAACPAKVVEVHVPSTSSPKASDCGRSGCYPWLEMAAGAGTFVGSDLEEDFDYFYIPDTEASCDSYSHWTRLYSKLAGQANFSFKKKIRYHGVWKGTFCSVESTCDPCNPGCPKTYFPNDLYTAEKPDSGTDVYRIVSAIEVNGAYTAGRVKVGYEPMSM